MNADPLPEQDDELDQSITSTPQERRSSPRAAPSASAQDWVRLLLAWLPDPLALVTVLGHPPQAGEDTTAPSAVVEQARARRAERRPYLVVDPRVPGPSGVLDAISNRADVKAAFAPMRWEPAFVDLRSVLSVQQMIRMTGLGERVASAGGTAEELVALCLPNGAPQQLSVNLDADSRGVTISAPNPNLRVIGAGYGEIESQPGQPKQFAASVLIGGANSYVQVAQYRDRFFLRDGYHRAVGLLRRGIPVVPCIFVHARSLQELTPNGGLFTDDVLFDERPPAVCDFLDDAVTMTTRRPSTRKLIRVRGDDFNI